MSSVLVSFELTHLLVTLPNCALSIQYIFTLCLVPPYSAYMASIVAAYFFATKNRFSFKVGPTCTCMTMNVTDKMIITVMLT